MRRWVAWLSNRKIALVQCGPELQSGHPHLAATAHWRFWRGPTSWTDTNSSSWLDRLKIKRLQSPFCRIIKNSGFLKFWRRSRRYTCWVYLCHWSKPPEVLSHNSPVYRKYCPKILVKIFMTVSYQLSRHFTQKGSLIVSVHCILILWQPLLYLGHGLRALPDHW